MWKGCQPFCLTCKDNAVGINGFESNHDGRKIVGLIEKYFIITYQYKCNRCGEEEKI
jgi:hypothetical protein